MECTYTEGMVVLNSFAGVLLMGQGGGGSAGSPILTSTYTEILTWNGLTLRG